MRKNFCLYPFNAFSIDNSGKQRICCNNNGWDQIKKNTALADPDFDILKSFNNPFHKELRQYFIEDKRHDTCQKCWEVEDQGHISYRQMYNRSFDLAGKDEDYWIAKCQPDGSMEHIEYMYLDITFGNKCNLKCIMCNGFNSTLFAKELYDNDFINEGYYQKLMKLDWYKDNEAIKKIFENVSSVQRIHILGGEPLLIDHQELLQKFIDMGTAKNIDIGYNTNFTTIPSEILESWKQFRKVAVCISVDSYKENNEFIRFPMKWAKLEKNIHTLSEIIKNHNNVYVQIHSTFGTYNMFDLPEFLDWIKELSIRYDFIEPHPMTNYVFAPTYFDPKNVPLQIKQAAYNRFKTWVAQNEEFINHCDHRYASGAERIGVITSYFLKILDEPCDMELYYQMIEKIKTFEKIRNCKFPGFNNLLEGNADG